MRFASVFGTQVPVEIATPEGVVTLNFNQLTQTRKAFFERKYSTKGFAKIFLEEDWRKIAEVLYSLIDPKDISKLRGLKKFFEIGDGKKKTLWSRIFKRKTNYCRDDLDIIACSIMTDRESFNTLLMKLSGMDDDSIQYVKNLDDTEKKNLVLSIKEELKKQI